MAFSGNGKGRTIIAAVILLGALSPALAQDAKPAYSPPPPASAQEAASFGTGIQRTMTLLATSAPQKRNTVRILFYGQSITEQKWWKEVADDLRRRFPHANLIIENRAIGGFASQLLVKDAEAALYSFYPDLVIFHVYGSHIEYENIIRRIRERTTAEILMQTDHVTKEEELTEEQNPARLTPKNWSAWMNHAFLPATAKKYGAELVDQRSAWKKYLQANGLKPAALLKDGVHLNDHGCYLMAELVKPHLRYAPDLPTVKGQSAPVRTYVVGKDLTWQNGKLVLEFDGNRIDLIAAAATGSGTGSASIRIDGKKPSEFAELYTVTRTSVYPGTPWPGVMKIGPGKPLQLESWTLRLTETDAEYKRVAFTVTGSLTGADGDGTSDQKFVSKSGRVVIEPDDWSLAHSQAFTKKPLPPGFEIKWKVLPLFVDQYAVPQITDPTVEYATTVAQGVKNGRHTLEIIAEQGKPLSIAAIRVYRPPLLPQTP